MCVFNYMLSACFIEVKFCVLWNAWMFVLAKQTAVEPAVEALSQFKISLIMQLVFLFSHLLNCETWESL